ncbi:MULTISPECIES: AbrB-like transcriptional regulator [unclassified Sphingomonas]|jgi:AbrB family transcriptional regulator (stage V sporulation protein T)|uniref:AbrB/MazE/SpoVT family DNA-binding domain-containing protein n=1 Tax=unclassified Sphingomonas TaxID=196159 RepID=UPI0025E6F22A|nr:MULTISPECIES: AbrB-like transcriptional regulator [unclassified Sphingomonas]
MTYHARVADNGEMVLPADVARAMGLKPGDRFRIDQDGLRIVLETDADVIAAGQRAFRATIRRPFDVDDFIADRRADAAHD